MSDEGQGGHHTRCSLVPLDSCRRRCAAEVFSRAKDPEVFAVNVATHRQALHKHPIHNITRDDILGVLKELERNSGKVAADRAKTALSTLFVWALDEKYVTGTPVLHIKRCAGNVSRKRTLSPAELREVWKATDAVDDEGKRLVNDGYAKIVKLLILTIQRKSEIGGLDWCEIIDGGALGDRIDLPEERTKNKLPHVVPLSKQVSACLPAKRNFTTKLFGRFDKGYTGWSKSKKELDGAILAARRKRDPKAPPMPGWVVHDIRRTGATMLRELRFADTHLVELILTTSRARAAASPASTIRASGWRSAGRRWRRGGGT